MKIYFEELIEMLSKTGSWDDGTSPREALTIIFKYKQDEAIKTTIMYRSTENTNIGIDLNKDDELMGIELF